MKLGRVSKNIIWIVAGKIAQAVCAVIINALTARYFGPSNYGLISYAASLVAFVTPLMQLGTRNIIVNELVKNPEKEGEVLGTSIAMTMCSSLACVLGLVSFVYIMDPTDRITHAVVFLYSLLLFTQSLELVQFWYNAKYLSKIVSLTSLAAYFITTGYKIFLLATEKGIHWFAISNALDHLMIAIVLLLIYRKKKGQRLRFSKHVLATMWRNGRPYIIPEMMGLVLQQSDRIMLRYAYGDGEVGLYSAALTTASMACFVFEAITVSYSPMILENKGKNEAAYEKSLTRLCGIVLYLSILQCVFILLFGDYIIALMYGAAFAESSLMLKIVVCYTLFSNLGSVRALWILAENKQRYLWYISLFGMLLNVALNAVMIKYYQGEGAAAATLITQIFTNIILVAIIKPLRGNLIYIWRSLNIKNWIKSISEE